MPLSGKNQRGFALVELILVITAVMVLVAFAYVRMGKNENMAREVTEQTVATAKARDEQLCAISVDYCTDEQKRNRRKH